MDSKITIPGLGQFPTDDAFPAPSNTVPGSSRDIEALSDSEMTTVEGAPLEIHARIEDEIFSSAFNESAAGKDNATDTTVPTAQFLPSDTTSQAVFGQDDSENMKMEDVQEPQNDNTAEDAAEAVDLEARYIIMDGSQVQEQHTTEIKSPPGSPSVTHALEAALDGLLGPTQEPVEASSSASVLTNGANLEAQDSTDHTKEHAPTFQVVPTEGKPMSVDGDADASPEWEVDSSPYESSSSDSSDDSSDDDSEVEESKMGIDETARLLMEADGGSDEEIDGIRAAKQAATVRTKNEQPDEPEPKPEITIDAEDTILPLGFVQHIVEGTHVVIEALRDGGEATILDRGTVLCKEDRTVLGVIHDTIATVHKPMYILKSSSEEELKKAGLERHAQIWYAKAHAVFVFPSQLKREKGSDASNLYDEEVGPEEVEYSDDEQEQAHKRERKSKKQRAKVSRCIKGNRGDDNDSRAYVNGDASLEYEDDDDGPYTPLSRPANFGMGLPPPPPSPAMLSPYPPAHGNRGVHHQGRRGDSRGRGGRGRVFNGRGRGGHAQSSPIATPQAPTSYLPPPLFAAANPPPMPGPWPFPIPPIPHYGQAASSNPSIPAPSFPMPNWSAGQPSPFPFTPVPPPNWPNAAQRQPQQANYSPQTQGYNRPAVQYPPGGAANAPVPPPSPNYQQQQQRYQSHYSGQAPNGQPQQRW